MTTISHPVLVSLAIVAALSLAIRTLLAVATARHARRRIPLLTCAPGISVLKPLRGLDDGLLANLRSLLIQDYPGGVELVLGAADYRDPAMLVAHALQREFPEHAIRVVLSSPNGATNPKVANLMGLSAVARHELLLVSDANVRVGPTYLRDMVAELGVEGVGLVANLVAGTDEHNLGSTLENLQLNGFTAAAGAGAAALGHPCVIGKSMLTRRADLAAIGGWAAVADVLGEDYILGRAFRRAGLGVRISSHVVAARSVGWTVRRFVERHLRWCQMRRRIAPLAYVFEPVLSPCPWLLGLAIGAVAGGEREIGVVALAGVAWAGVLEACHARILRGQWPHAGYLAAASLKEVVMLAIWAWAWFDAEVTWRGRAYRIGPDSALVPATSLAGVESASSV